MSKRYSVTLPIVGRVHRIIEAESAAEAVARLDAERTLDDIEDWESYDHRVQSDDVTVIDQETGHEVDPENENEDEGE